MGAGTGAVNASGSGSYRGLRGLKATGGSGNLESGERDPSGDMDSPRTGKEVDIRCAFFRRPSFILCCVFVPALDVVYMDPLSCR